ncbi:DUF4296 domain-containing protein [Flavobacterium sp. 7A]|uniref:DUF4296 domain-containing protein n=1 Tax=Flavobacterium sp. 7A TaxID=2940571 RepID=UPI0022275FF9|nr:DUF4296 domain-containing protein [Flavobacterium sp. 7A]MCW2119184.1 hypothetical protein [Flavobacterium sp. 7A]
MKKIGIIIFLFFWVGCKEEIVKKPDNLIDKNKMVDILYDLTLLNVVKYQYADTLKKYKGTELEYIFKKYQVDSLQFAKSNSYYAADYKHYKDMFDQIKDRIQSKKTVLDTLLNRKERADLLLNKKSTTAKDTAVKKKSIKERLEHAKKDTKGVLE